MQLSQSGLRQLLVNAIIEVRFKRRHLKEGAGPWRRMLCTNNIRVLKSLPGRMSLLYKNPKGHHLPYSPQVYNLVVAWDILQIDYRQISLDDYDIVTIIPTRNQQELDKWWVYFNEQLLHMSPEDKLKFMQNT
jgi:hypothetical protein